MTSPSAARLTAAVPSQLVLLLTRKFLLPQVTAWYFTDSDGYVDRMLEDLDKEDAGETGSANTVHLIKEPYFKMRSTDWITNIASEKFWIQAGLTTEDWKAWSRQVEREWGKQQVGKKEKTSFCPTQVSTVVLPAQHELMFQQLPLKLKRAVTDFSSTAFYNDKSGFKTTTPFVTWLAELVQDTEKQEYVRNAVKGTTDSYCWAKGDVLKPPLVDPDNALLCCSNRLFPNDKVEELLISLVKSVADTAPGLTLQPTKAQALELISDMVYQPALHFLKQGMFETKLQGMKLEANSCYQQFKESDELRAAGLKRLEGNNTNWILSRLGIDYRYWGSNGAHSQPDEIPVTSQERLVRIATGDVLVEEALQVATKQITLDIGSGASMVFLDMPFGWGMHAEAAPCQKEWDKEHWTGEQVVLALKNSSACSLLDQQHVFIGFCARAKIGEISDALEKAGYGRVHTLTFTKLDSSR